ncbi:phosphoesterase RecJ domain-containing protein [Lutibacter oricola]|uniref:Phosphoesterase RecJ domain-containing protein n=1 Tax=Lutibacter oricola TaxID=762486 RepID=A0A1H3F1E3_9FLAO|nr:bifunctional oligoribonuclease/PAP phosphatase NrnA [Lutibacter oricola]SDX84710.1 phosphoesterase RecJ domain-containing protein [Lutibacter oricola]
MNKSDINEVKELLSTKQNIVVVPHRNPDGDAMGSCLAMYHYLQGKGHNVTVVAPNDYPDFLKWLPGSKNAFKFDMQNRQSKEALDEASITFLLDFNALHRVGDDMANTLEKFMGTFIMIDHHQQPDNIAKYLYSDTSICSTCQMVYQFFEMLNDLEAITPEIATCLYAGIMTDTGSFRFASTTSKTHRIVADLMDKGAKNAQIHNNVYDTNSYSRLQLLGRSLSNMVVIDELKTAYIKLTQEDLDEFNYQKGDTEGVVNYALSLKGVVFAVIFIEDTDQKIIKMSFRSKGKFSVNKFARAHFNGGGHDNAAGGRSTVSIDATISNFLSILPDYKNDLKNSYEK